MPRIFTILNFRVSIDSSSRKNDTKTTTKFCLHLGWKKQKLEKTKSKNKRGRISCISSFFHDEKNKNLKKWSRRSSSMKINENQWKSMKINENEQLLLGIRGGVWGVPPPSNCWQNLLRGIRGGYPPRPIAGRCCCGGPGGGTPSQSGVSGGIFFAKFWI